MDDYLKIQNRINDSDFQKKVKISAIKNATVVIATKPQTRPAEVPYLQRVIAAPEDSGWLIPLVYQVALDVNIIADDNADNDKINNAVKVAIPKFSIPA